MLYIDTCVLLAVLTPEVHSSAATSFLAQAQAGAILQVFERSLAPGLLLLELEPQDFRNANACLRGWITTLCSLDAPFVAAAKQLGLEAELLMAGGKPVSS